MAEKVEDPLRGIYRELGIPLAGEGDFHDVKPNAEIKQWPGPFDSIREVFDPEYAKAKKLALTQQSMLQDVIHSTNAIKALRSVQQPTVEDAQSLYPGFPTPASAYKTTPQAPLQSPEMPVLQGTQQVQIPSKVQGPMPGVMTPLGEAAVKWFGATAENPLNREDNKEFVEKGPQFYQEGPRPMQTINVGEYGPDQAPSQATVMDPKTPLPPAFQAQLAALVHQTSLKQTQPHYPTADEIKYSNALNLGIQAWKEAHPGMQPSAQEMFTIQQQAAGGFEKPPLPGSTKARIEGAQAVQQEAQAGVAPAKAQAEVRDINNRADHTAAQTKEISTLLDAKLQELISRTDLHKLQGSTLAQKAELAEFREKLGIDNLKWKVIHTLLLTDDLDKESKLAGIKSLIENDPNLQVRAQDPTFLQQLFGQTTGSGIKIEPRQGGPAQPPRMPKVTSQAPGQSITPEAAPVQDDGQALRQMGLSMKEGDVKDYKGQKYRRKGGKLEKVN